MELKGKCKEDFEKWYSIEFENRNLPYKQGFDISDLSIKYGVYVDFFDSKGIYIEIEHYSSDDWLFKIFNPTPVFQSTMKEPRQEVRMEAIRKANEIYNKQ